MTQQERTAWAREYTRINRKLEQKWFPRVKKTLDSKVSSLIAKLQEDGIDAAVRYLQTDLTNAQLTEVIDKMYQQVGLIHASRNERRLRIDVRADAGKSFRGPAQVKGFGNAKYWIRFIKDYLYQFLIEKITFKVNETTRNYLLGVMQEGIEKGWGVAEFVSHLRVINFTEVQAARIVRTEINRASNVGVIAQGTTFEYELNKIWISVRDRRTRGVDPEDHADHIHLDGQTVDFDGVFVDSRNSHELAHPGDPKAAAEDVINCRCVFASIAKRDENGRMIPKKQKMAA